MGRAVKFSVAEVKLLVVSVRLLIVAVKLLVATVKLLVMSAGLLYMLFCNGLALDFVCVRVCVFLCLCKM